jgi:hypothetical protein
VPNSISDSSKNQNTLKYNIHKISSSNVSDATATTFNNKTSLNQLLNETILETYFSTENFTNITAQVGSIVEIPCTVHHIAEGTVSFNTSVLSSSSTF